MAIKNTFVGGKMNKDIDERLLPNNQYPHASNIRVANSDSSDVGSIENNKGNKRLTNLNLTNGVVLGGFADDAKQKIYWFVTSDEKDLVLEYDYVNSSLSVVLESSRPDGVLNFNRKYLITGVVKIVNDTSGDDLLGWCDDYNNPRLINIERCKSFAVDGFIEEDICLIKKPPIYPPKATLTYTSSTLENNIKDKFLSFSYRYKYLDGEYSAMSSFTNYKFNPSKFELDYQTLENNGMINSYNAVDIEFNTGSKRVTDVEILFKESNSNNVYVIESFNKEDEQWGDDEVKNFLFSNNKVYTVLPEYELSRTYDNVPRKAKAMELIGNRLVFGNYLEGYNLKNKYGDDININMNVSLLSKNLEGEELNTSLDGSVNVLKIDFGSQELKQGKRLTFDLKFRESTYGGSYDGFFEYILDRDFTDVNDLAQDENFIYFVETLMSNTFIEGFTATDAPEDSTVDDSSVGILIDSSTATSISLKAPVVVYEVDNTPNDPEDDDFDYLSSSFYYLATSTAYIKETAVDSSLKTNRDYEVGLLYRDGFTRSSTVLTDDTNTIYVPQKFSLNQNKLVINLNHLPPDWADTYKIVVKQPSLSYNTIYATKFYEEGLFRWVKLEGANKDKVKEGDTLIVKADLSGTIDEVIKVRVLEVSNKEPDFIEGNVDDNENEIKEEQGLYMKIKPVGFDMSFNNNLYLSHSGYTASKSGRPLIAIPESSNETLAGYKDEDTGQFVDYRITGGSRINIKFVNSESDGYRKVYEKEFIVQGDYDNFQEWWEAEVVDLGVEEENFNWYFERYPDNALYLRLEGAESGARFERSKLSGDIDISLVDGLVIFETEPEESEDIIFYETEQVFDIEDGYHKANIQDQDISNPAIIELDFYNCFVQGNGAESYRYQDAFNKKYLNIDLRPTSTSIEEFKEVRRGSDLTYSETYNENNNINGLNVFNLARANYKEDIEKRYGSIQKLFARDTDLVVFQEDKTSRVLYGKDLLMNADGSFNIVSVEDILGRQVTYAGEYGISKSPESFSYDANNLYWLDPKRGCALRLGQNGITEISRYGMRTWYKDKFQDSIYTKKVCAVDPYYDQYVANIGNEDLSPIAELDCSQRVLKTDYSGIYEANIDFGIKTGQLTFVYTSNGLPVRYTFEWNGQTYTTGFVGESSYDDELNDLGLPSTTGLGSGTISFNKTSSVPRKVKVTIEAPLCDTEFTLNPTCLVPENLKVTTIILNDEDDEGLTMNSRYRWSNPTYLSPLTSYNSTFGEGELERFELNSGAEGEQGRPMKGSTVRMEMYKGYPQTALLFDENKLGYLISNSEYDENDLSTILSNANYPTLQESVNSNGDIIKNIEFDLDTPNSEDNLYLIWDYRNPKLEIGVDTKIKIYFDNSGSMDSTLAPLQTMRDTILKDRLLPLYDGDETAYNNNVTVENMGTERTFQSMNMNGETPDGNVVVMVFQDESTDYGADSGTFDNTAPREADYDTDMSIFRSRLSSFDPTYYRGVIFQVQGQQSFGQFLQSVQQGFGNYSGSNGLSDKLEVNYKYDLTDGGTPQYYLDKIVEALTELGYEL